MIQKWAQGVGLRLIDYKKPLVSSQSFVTASMSLQTYRVTVEQADGKVAEGWLHVKGFFMKKTFEVQWDKQKTESRGFPVIIPVQQDKNVGAP